MGSGIVGPIEKNAERRGGHLVFLDESGFLLIPNVTRTWSPKGLTPLSYHLYKQDRISAINALAVSPKRRRLALYLQFRARNLTGVGISTHFSSICFAIFEAPLFYYGTVEPSIGGKRLNNISVSALASRKNTSLPRRRNLIRQNMFGTKRTVPSPMVRPRTWQSSKGSSGIQPGESENPRSSFGLVSTHLICLAQNNSFHYLCKI